MISPARPLRLAVALGLLAVTAGAQQKAAAPAPAVKISAPTQLTEALKKVSARYARTDERIEVLVGRRRHPQPLPASLPNPFYRGTEPSELAVTPEPLEEAVPAAPDISDADTLARIAPTLRITGLVVLNQQSFLTINSISCKVGDVIPIAGKDRDSPLFIQVRKITPDGLTLGLNDAELTLPLKR